MAEDAAFFVRRGGSVWACWPDGRPAVELGAEESIVTAMQYFLNPDSADEDVDDKAFDSAHKGASEAAASRAQIERRADRHELRIYGRVVSSSGSRDVTIRDLSGDGCRFHDRFTSLKKDAQVSIKIGPVGPVIAYVRWRSGEYVGVEFDNPLYPSVLEHIRQHFDSPA